MTRQKLVLPSLSMPWGRWVQEQLDATERDISSQNLDANSTGNLFSSRADLLQERIASTPSIAAIYERQITPFSVTRFFTPSASAYVYNSPTYTFNPPRRDRIYNCQVIAVMDVQGVNLPFSQSLIRVNEVDTTYQHENMEPGFQTRATFSIAGAGRVSPGQSVSVQFGVIASDASTLTFSRASLWCTFTGSLL